MTELVLYPQAKKGKYTMPKGIKTADMIKHFITVLMMNISRQS